MIGDNLVLKLAMVLVVRLTIIQVCSIMYWNLYLLLVENAFDRVGWGKFGLVLNRVSIKWRFLESL